MKRIIPLLLLLPIIVQAFAISFYDVPEKSWYAPYVKEASSLGIVTGYKDPRGNLTGQFKPQNPVTLAEVLKMSLEAAGYDFNKYPLLNSQMNHWVDPYYRITLREEFGIFIGVFEDVDKPATRTEVASTVTDAFLPGKRGEILGHVDFNNPYKDIPVATTHPNGTFSWGWGVFPLKLTEDGILSGDKDENGNPTGYFRPDDAINRAEAIKIIMEARKLYGQPGINRDGSQ